MDFYTSTSPFARKLLVGMVIILIAPLLSALLATEPIIGGALIAMIAMALMLFTKPAWFLMFGIFFFYGALNIVDTEVFGRVAGLFRMKDLFFLAIAAVTIATVILERKRRPTLEKTLAWSPWIMFFLWWLWQLFYTIQIIGESPVLALRAGRHFFAYALPFFILYWLRTEKDWKQFFVFIHILGFLTIILSILSAIGINLSIVSGSPDTLAGRYNAGIFKFYNPGESLVYALFILSLWRTGQRLSARNLCLLLIFALGAGMFVFRARLAGIVCGVAVGFIVARPFLRRRLIALGLPLIGVMLIFFAFFGVIAKGSGDQVNGGYLLGLSEYFKDAAESLITGDGDAVAFRRRLAEERIPLLKEHPLCGVGFISPFGGTAWNLYRYGTMGIGHIDAGWISVLLQLGTVGVIALLGLFACAAREGAQLARRAEAPPNAHAFGLTLLGFVILMIASTYSFSYPTYEPSIVTFSILLSWGLRYSKEIDQKKIPVDEETEDQGLRASIT